MFTAISRCCLAARKKPRWLREENLTDTFKNELTATGSYGLSMPVTRFGKRMCVSGRIQNPARERSGVMLQVESSAQLLTGDGVFLAEFNQGDAR